MASQLAIYLAHVIPLAVLWFASITETLPVYNYAPTFTHHFILYAPLYAVFLLGMYALVHVVHGVFTFNDCSRAKEELLKEIKEAREDLRKRKVIE